MNYCVIIIDNFFFLIPIILYYAFCTHKHFTASYIVIIIIYGVLSTILKKNQIVFPLASRIFVSFYDKKYHRTGSCINHFFQSIAHHIIYNNNNRDLNDGGQIIVTYNIGLAAIILILTLSIPIYLT